MDSYRIYELQKKIAQTESELIALNLELNRETKDSLRCSHCHEWLSRDSILTGTYEETKTETVFSDAGYGDDDKIAEVTRLIAISRCPKCGAVIDKKSVFLNQKNERLRKS